MGFFRALIFPKSLKNIMKPFKNRALSIAERVFLSRVRRVVENVFAIMSSTFRIHEKSICLHPKKVEKVIFATLPCTIGYEL